MQLHYNLLLTLFCSSFQIGYAADGPNCDVSQASCRASIASEWEATQHASTDFDFYRSPPNFSPYLPQGSLLHVEEVTNLTNYTVPTGLTMSRIIYTSANLNGTTLPTTAYILWPYAPLNEGQGYPMVAWAHGTSGLLRNCAPSNYRDLQYNFMVPFLLAFQGYTVVAPDYAGLGINATSDGVEIGHPWVAGPAQANDLANAIIAARKAFPDYLRPSAPFLAMGHSQGAQAAWSFAERLVNNPISGYRGTIAIAPPTDFFIDAKAFSASPNKLIAGVTAAFPAYNYSGFTDLGYNLWNNVLKPTGACLPTDTFTFLGVTAEQYLKPDWLENPTVKQYAKLSKTGGKPFRGPLLILAGEMDSIIPEPSIIAAVNDTCAVLKKSNSKESLELITYAGADHFPLIQASSRKWLSWVQNRLSAHPSNVKYGCSRSEVQGFRTNDTLPSFVPNWLVEWAPPAEFWKYLL